MYKFFINNIQTNEPLNWNEIVFGLEQDDNYYGYIGTSPLDKLILYKDAAKKVKEFNKDFNPITSYVIKKKSSAGVYNVLYNYSIDYTSYEENYNKKEGLTITVSLLDSHIQGKVRDRESIEVKVGNNKSIEDVSLTGNDLINWTARRKTLRHSASFKFNESLQSNTINFQRTTPPDTKTLTFPYMHYSGGGAAYYGSAEEDGHNAIGFEMTQQNLSFAQTSTTNLRAEAEPLDPSFECSLSEMLLNVSDKDRYVNMKADIDFNVVLFGGALPVKGANYLNIAFVEYKPYNDTVGHYEVNSLITTSTFYAEVNPDADNGNLDPSVVGTDYEDLFYVGAATTYRKTPINFTKDIYFTKKKDHTYGFITINYENSGFTIVSVLNSLLELNELGSNELDFYYNDNNDEFEDSTHKGQLIYKVLESVIEQITDTPNSFYSEYFGHTDYGYAANGEGSGIMVTNGLLMRKGLDPNGNEPNLTVNFLDTYKTATSLKGLMMFYKDGKIHIEKRDWSRDDVITLDYEDLTIKNLEEKIYNSLVVGNEKVLVEDLNGTNEFNILQNYSIPINGKKNELDLKTSYCTSYTALEYARRTGFLNSKNIDSNYDDLVFFVAVEKKGGVWITKSVSNKYDIIEGVILPDTAYNIEFSPKRMLINNRDILDAIFHKSIGTKIRFESTENLAPLESRLIGGNLIVEQEDFTTETPIYKTEVAELTTGIEQAEKVFNQLGNLYQFEYENQLLKGYLWSIREEEQQTKVILLLKN